MRYWILLVFFLTGCSSFVDTIKNPSDLWRFDAFILHLEANQLLNADHNNQSRSTVFRIYQFKNQKNIENFEYDDWLSLNTLNDQVLNCEQYILKPNETLDVKNKLLRETKYIAIVFFFSQLDDKDSWRKVISVEDLEKHKILHLKVNNKHITMIDDGNY